MPETITFPDVAAAVIPYLTTRLTARGKPAVVAGRIPNPRPARMVRVTNAGGYRVALALSRPIVLVECWDNGDKATYDLAALCSAELEAASRSGQTIAAGVWIAANPEDDFSLPVNFPDDLTDQPRYQFTAALTVGALTI